MHQKVCFTNFICHECNIEADDVYEHYKHCHPTLRLFKCYLCKESSQCYGHIKNLVRHHKVHHKGMQQQPNFNQPQQHHAPENHQEMMTIDDDNQQENQELLQAAPPRPPPITEMAAIFMCSLLHEPSVPVSHVFAVAEQVQNMYEPLLRYLQCNLLPNLDEIQRLGKCLIFY